MSLNEFVIKSRERGRDVRARLGALRPLVRPVCILSGVYLLGISAILRADFNYIDDMGRAFEGYQGWDNFSRHLSNFFSAFLHADSYLTDISPLPQILAVVLLAIASVIVLCVITGKTRFSFWEYAAVLPLGLSPYMLECLSYKFDAPYMALSVLVAVLPLLCAPPRPWWQMLLASFVCTVVMCSTYQASSGLLPMLVVLMAFKMWSEGQSLRDILRFIAAAAAGYCAGMLVFSLFFMEPVEFQGYTDTGLPPMDQLVPLTVEHFRTYIQKVREYIPGKWLLLAGLLGASFLFVAVRDSARNKLLALLLALAAGAVMLLFSFGLYPLLQQPTYDCRAMYGLADCVVFWAVYAVSAKKTLPSKLVCFALSWCFFVFAFTYGNALYSQKVYTQFRIEETVDAIKDLDVFDDGTPVIAQISGDIYFAPAIRGSLESFPILRTLVPITYSGGWVWGRYGLQNYYGLPSLTIIDSSYASTRNTVDLRDLDMPVLDETIYHTIRGQGNFLLIELK